MKHFDTVIRGGTVVTAADSAECDVGIIDGRVAALGLGFSDADRVIDATGKLVLPGGIEGHCHIEQKSSVGGVMSADDFFTGTRSAVLVEPRQLCHLLSRFPESPCVKRYRITMNALAPKPSSTMDFT